MMKIQLFLLSLIVIVISSCADREGANVIVEPIEPPLELLKDHVTLQDLQIGQRSIFAQYQSTCENIDSNFWYTGNKIIWEVVSKDGQRMLKEEFTEDSPLRDGNQNLEPIYYSVEAIEKGILLTDRVTSMLFYFYGNDTLRLNRDMDVELTQQSCLMQTPSDIFIGDEMGHIDQFRIGDMEVKDKTVVSCVPFFELDAYLIYSDNHLYASHTVSSSEFGGVTTTQIAGWELIK